MPALIAALSDPVGRVRPSAGLALFKIRADARAVPMLVMGLKDEDRDVRFWSARALVSVTPSPLQALGALMESLREENQGGVLDSVRWALQVIGPASVPPLAALLTDAQPRLRARAVAALSGGSAARARQAIPLLLAALHDPEARVRQFAAQSLGIIGQAHQGKAADLGDAWSDVPRALGQRLTDTDNRVSERAAWALMWLGSDARLAADELRAVPQDGDKRTQQWAAKALEHIAEQRID